MKKLALLLCLLSSRAEAAAETYRLIQSGSLSGIATGNIDMDGTYDIILDADGNSKIETGTDDRFILNISGAEQLRLAPSFLRVNLTNTTPFMLSISSNDSVGIQNTGTGLAIWGGGGSADATTNGATFAFAIPITGAGTASSGFVQPVTNRTTNLSLDTTYCGGTLTNSGASGEVDFTLPATAVGCEYTFIVNTAQILKVIANTGDTIRAGTNVSASAGNIVSTAAGLGDTVTMIQTSTSTWVVTSVMTTAGTWTVN